MYNNYSIAHNTVYRIHIAIVLHIDMFDRLKTGMTLFPINRLSSEAHRNGANNNNRIIICFETVKVKIDYI